MTQNGNGKAVTTQLSDDLIARAQAVARRSDELLELLEDARQRLVESDGDGEVASGRRAAPKRTFKPANDSKPRDVPTSEAKSDYEMSEGLRLLTSQMAADGADRRDIARCLREDFAIENPEPILKKMGL